MLSPTHVLWTLVCLLSLLQGNIKLTFADQHSQQTDHLDAYKPKPEIKVCIQFRAVKCGVVRCGAVWGVVWCGVVWGVVWWVLCGVVLCGVVGVMWCGVVWCGIVWCDVWCSVVSGGCVVCGAVWCGVVGCVVGAWCVVLCGVVW